MRLEALEVHVFQQGDAEILVPQRHAISSATQAGGSSASAALPVEQLLDRSIDTDMRSKLERIIELWRASGNQVITTDKTFCLKTQGTKRLFSMFWATPNEEWGLQPNFSGMNDAGIPEHMITAVRESLAQIPGIPREKTFVKSYPSIKFSQVTLDGVTRFTEVMIETAKKWHDQLALSN